MVHVCLVVSVLPSYSLSDRLDMMAELMLPMPTVDLESLITSSNNPFKSAIKDTYFVLPEFPDSNFTLIAFCAETSMVVLK